MDEWVSKWLDKYVDLTTNMTTQICPYSQHSPTAYDGADSTYGNAND